MEKLETLLISNFSAKIQYHKTRAFTGMSAKIKDYQINDAFFYVKGIIDFSGNNADAYVDEGRIWITK